MTKTVFKSFTMCSAVLVMLFVENSVEGEPECPYPRVKEFSMFSPECIAECIRLFDGQKEYCSAGNG